jgi:hypothetical protein
VQDFFRALSLVRSRIFSGPYVAATLQDRFKLGGLVAVLVVVNTAAGVRRPHTRLLLPLLLFPPPPTQDFFRALSLVRSRTFSGPYVASTLQDRFKLGGLVAVLVVVNTAVGGDLSNGLGAAAAVFLFNIIYELLLSNKLKQYAMCPVIDLINHSSINTVGGWGLGFQGAAGWLCGRLGASDENRCISKIRMAEARVGGVVRVNGSQRFAEQQPEPVCDVFRD